jgi:hypothetical protein
VTCEPCSLPVALFPPVQPVSPAQNIDSLPTLCYPPLAHIVHDGSSRNRVPREAYVVFPRNVQCAILDV